MVQRRSGWQIGSVRRFFVAWFVLAGVAQQQDVRLSAAELPGDLGTRRQGTDWPAFLGPTSDGKSSETGLVVPWPPQGPRLVWSRALGPSYGLGSVSRGRYFQFDYQDRRAIVACWHSETGRKLWQFDYESNYEDLLGYEPGPRTTPVVDRDRLYCFGVEGMLHCLRVVDGTLLWKVDTQKKFGVVQNFFGVGSCPVVFGDLVIVAVGGSPAEDQDVGPGQLDRVHGNGSAIVAFSRETGEVVYQCSDELASYATPRIVQHAGRPWGFVFARGGLLAFDPRSGREEFHFPWRAKILESVNASTPLVWDNHVFISETYGPGSALLAFRTGGYEVEWSDELRPRNKSLQTHWNTPVLHEGYLYASSGRHKANAELRCVEAATGRVMWSEPGLTRCSLVYVDQHLICQGEDGVLHLLRANPRQFDRVSEVVLRGALTTSGPEEAEVRDESAAGRSAPLLRDPAWAAPIVSHGLLYVRGRDRVVCLEIIPSR